MLSYLSRDIQWRKINDISAFVFLGSILLNNASLMIFLLCCSALAALMLVFVGRRLFGSHELRFDAPRQDARAQQVATVISQQGFSLVRNGLLPLNVQSISQTFSRYCNEMKGHNSKLTFDIKCRLQKMKIFEELFRDSFHGIVLLVKDR